MRKSNNILFFDNLSQFDSLIHGFSTRSVGSMRPSHPEVVDSLKKFAAALKIDFQKIVRTDQVHSNTVYWATEKDWGHTIEKTDGLLSEEKNVFLGVITADCVPVLLYDQKKKYVSAVHAGWRGLYHEIIKQAVTAMVDKGSDPANIFAGIGPCIGVCCYNIAKEHEEKLLSKFPDWKNFIVHKESKIFLDLSKVANYQLRSLGIPANNIEDANFCTAENLSDLYSYRREGKGVGEQMGIIGLV